MLATAALALCTTTAFSAPQTATGLGQGVKDRNISKRQKNINPRTDLSIKFVDGAGLVISDANGPVPVEVVAVRQNGTTIKPNFHDGVHMFRNVGEKTTLVFAAKGMDAIPMAMPEAYEAFATIYLNEATKVTKVLQIKPLDDRSTKVPPGPMANDLCANAVAIADGATAFSTVGAGTDGPANAGCQFDTQTYHDVWYVYTALGDGNLNVSTCNNADYDTDLVVYNGANCGALALLGCNDDQAGCAGFSSDLNVAVVSGNQYLIRVGGFSDGDSGTGTLTVTGPGGGGGNNDLCADAIEIFDGATAFDTTGAATDGPANAGCQFDTQTYHDIWYTYTATCNGTLNVTTCNTAAYDTDLVVYDGTDCNSLVLLGCNDDQGGCAGFSSDLDVTVVQGNEYLIRIGGFSDGDQGTGTVTLTCTGDGGGDGANLCDEALPITDGCTPFSTVGATTDGPANAGCQFDTQTYHDIWYTYTATCNGELTVSTCNMADYDTDLVVYDGTDCNSLVLLGCNDDQAGCAGFSSELVVPVVMGNDYLIRVGGFSDGDQGTGTVCLSCEVPPDPPANDNCANAEMLMANDTVTFDNTNATQDDFLACGDNAAGIVANVWYTVVGTGNTMTASTCNAGTLVSDTRISVYCGACGSLSCIDGNDDNCPAGGPGFASGVSWCSAPGITYYISVGNFSDATVKGVIQLDISDNGIACGIPSGSCVAVGACCLGDGTCVVTTEDDCGGQGGVYQGDDTGCTGEQIDDGGFEAGAFSGNWAEASSNFGTPLCTLGGCGAGGGTGPNTGDWWAWFGGIAAPEVGSVQQTVTIPSSATDLTFWLEQPASSGNGTDFMNVRIDGNLVYQTLESAGPFIGYVPVSVPIGAFADDGLHVVRFESTISGVGGVSNFFVDDISLAVDLNPCEPPVDCYVIDFETEDDFTTPLGNGQLITTPPEFGNLISLSTTGTAQGLNEGLSIFDTDPAGPNAGTLDPDLLVDLGNCLIIQETNWPDMTGDFFDVPNDERFGGTIFINFLAPAEAISIDLIDIDPFPGDQHAVVTLTDGAGKTRTYQVPTGWTTDISNTGGAGYGTLDLTTLANQPGAFSTATASEQAGFDASGVVQVKVFLNSSGGIDNLEFCQ